MNTDEFRRMALSLPETEEGSHQGHPDFRVRGKVFATLGPEGDWGMVKLTPDDQAERVRSEPHAFEPFNGAWGRQGCTKVYLEDADTPSVLGVLKVAWRRTAPASLVAQYDEGDG
jgi:hypothetical protein